MLGASNIRQQTRLWTLLGRPDMIKKNNDERDADHDHEIAALEEIMLTRTADEWEEFLQARHVPAARVRTMARGAGRSADRQPRRRAPHAKAATASTGGFGVPLAAFRSPMAARASTRRRRRWASTTRRFWRSWDWRKPEAKRA